MHSGVRTVYVLAIAGMALGWAVSGRAESGWLGEHIRWLAQALDIAADFRPGLVDDPGGACDGRRLASFVQETGGLVAGEAAAGR